MNDLFYFLFIERRNPEKVFGGIAAQIKTAGAEVPNPEDSR